MKRLLIVSGRSGSGKSSALHILEDLGYYTIDNLPLSLLPEIVAKLDQENHLDMLALGVDVRTPRSDLLVTSIKRPDARACNPNLLITSMVVSIMTSVSFPDAKFG